MAKISKDQTRFLQAQSISFSRLFDASGMSRSNYQAVMSELDMIIAFGVSPCKKSGHTLRTRAGHCAQCNTQALAFHSRFCETGEVYAAASKRTGLVKLGTAQNSHARMKTLNNIGYGGATDWKVHCHYECNKSGRVEFLAQNILSKQRASETYVKAGKTVDCRELFYCSISTAAKAIQAALKQVF